MSEGENKKGFSGLSSLESNIEPIEVDSTPKKDSPEASINPTPSAPSSPSKPPPVSIVAPRAPEIPALVFLKKYWVLVGIGLYLAYAVLSSNGSSTSSGKYSTLQESMPNYGSNQSLNSSQIYYCLAENARIEANQVTVNNYDSTSVSRFNNTVADYNARCASYRYKQSAMNSATKAFDENRYLIESQGRGRM